MMYEMKENMNNVESKQAQQLKLLNEVSTSLQGLLASDQFYQEIVDMIEKTFHYYCIHIFSVSADGSRRLSRAELYKFIVSN